MGNRTKLISLSALGTAAAILFIMSQAGAPAAGGQAGAAPPLPRVAPGGAVEHGSRSSPRVAITFDACENEKPAGFDYKIWEVLKREHVKATIFLGGRWMEDHPQETRIIGQSDLIEIGNHSYLHPDFRSLSPRQMKKEILDTQNLQWQLTGKQGIVFRFPYGYYNDEALAMVAELGLHAIQWDVVSGDPSKKVTAPAMIKDVLAHVRNGSIIIFHINGRGWHTAEALPQIIDGLRKKGLEPVFVSDLLGYPLPPAAKASP
jgi:peptidoglycan/xylan/chitin deacetylase (PgdA/CDA1 family)